LSCGAQRIGYPMSVNALTLRSLAAVQRAGESLRRDIILKIEKVPNRARAAAFQFGAH